MRINSHCPVCGNTDRTQKVSAIVAGQTQTISGTGFEDGVAFDGAGNAAYDTFSTVTYNSTQQSTLAQRLSPPRRPSAGTNGRGTVLLILGVLFAVGIASLCGSTSFIVLPIGLVLMAALISGPTANIVTSVVAVLVGLVVIGIPLS